MRVEFVMLQTVKVDLHGRYVGHVLALVNNLVSGCVDLLYSSDSNFCSNITLS